ncbi:transposable element Tcb2 transposase, partial [Nephila pilipes]
MGLINGAPRSIACGCLSPLFCISCDTTSQRCVDDVFHPVTLPFLQGMLNAIYQNNIPIPHTTLISQHALQDTRVLPWPSVFPVLSPIEHVWDVIRPQRLASL